MLLQLIPDCTLREVYMKRILIGVYTCKLFLVVYSKMIGSPWRSFWLCVIFEVQNGIMSLLNVTVKNTSLAVSFPSCVSSIQGWDHVVATLVTSHVNKSPWSPLLWSLDCLLHQPWRTSLKQWNVWYTERHSPWTSSTLGSEYITYQTRAIICASGVWKLKFVLLVRKIAYTDCVFATAQLTATFWVSMQ